MSETWKRAHFLWIGPRLSPIEILSIKSHLRQGWDVTLFLYDSCEGIPEGCKIRNGRDILPDHLLFQDEKPSGVKGTFTGFADLFRWKLLSQEAGWWFDMDIISIAPPRPIPFEAPMRFGSTWEHEFGQCATNCAMYSNGSHSLYLQGFARSQAIISEGKPREFCELGPFMLQSLIREHSAGSMIAPWWEFCPFPWRQISSAASPDAKQHIVDRLRVVKHTIQQRRGALIRPAVIRKESLAVHLHNEVWRQARLNKGGPFFRLSFVGRSMMLHDIEGVQIT